jgi:flagellar hook-associated protein 1 FlgK
MQSWKVLSLTARLVVQPYFLRLAVMILGTECLCLAWIGAGDTFDISYNQNSIGDNRNGMALASIYQNGIMDNGTVTFVQGYHMLSTDVSIQTNSAQIQHDSAKTLQKQAKDNYNQISAVSLEEESINLANYQQAYQASAQVLQAAKTVFESVISMLRG